MRATLVVLAGLGAVVWGWVLCSPTTEPTLPPVGDRGVTPLLPDYKPKTSPSVADLPPSEPSIRVEVVPVVTAAASSIPISALPGRGMEAVRLMNITLRNNGLPPIPDDAKLQQGDVETFVTAFFDAHNDYRRRKDTYFDSVHDLANKQAARIEEAIASGREPIAEEVSVPIRHDPSEHVSILHPSMSSKTYLLRVPASSVMQEWSDFQSANQQLATLCDKNLRSKFSK